jgi:hypothetical protein
MGRAVLLLSLIGTTILFTVGLVNPDSPVMWVASTFSGFALLRLGIMVALAILLVTHPPRNLYLRLAIGMLAAGLVGWCLNATYNNEMKFLDTLSILQFGVSAGLAVLELEDEPAPASHHKKAKAKTAH